MIHSNIILKKSEGFTENKEKKVSHESHYRLGPEGTGHLKSPSFINNVASE